MDDRKEIIVGLPTAPNGKQVRKERGTTNNPTTDEGTAATYLLLPTTPLSLVDAEHSRGQQIEQRQLAHSRGILLLAAS